MRRTWNKKRKRRKKIKIKEEEEEKKKENILKSSTANYPHPPPKGVAKPGSKRRDKYVCDYRDYLGSQ